MAVPGFLFLLLVLALVNSAVAKHLVNGILSGPPSADEVTEETALSTSSSWNDVHVKTGGTTSCQETPVTDTTLRNPASATRVISRQKTPVADTMLRNPSSVADGTLDSLMEAILSSSQTRTAAARRTRSGKPGPATMDAGSSVTPAESSVAALTEMPLRKPRQGSFFKTDQAEDSGHACQEGNEHPPRRQDPEGRVQWAGTGIAESCRWLIDVRSSEAVGLVLQWDAVDLRRSAEAAAEDDTVVVYGGLEPLPTNRLARVQGSLPVSPILVPAGQALIHLVAYRHTGAGPQPPMSRFSLRYTARPAQSLPPQVGNGTIGRYNCSPPYVVPEALRCDMVEQCADGQDERNNSCPYLDAECGEGWIRQELHGIMIFCFMFVFPENDVSPDKAGTRCREANAYLGVLPYLRAKQLAANVTSLSGHEEVIVNLKPFMGYSSLTTYSGPWMQRMYFLYRFMWYWSPWVWFELEGPPPQMQRKDQACASLRVVPSVYLKPVTCSSELHAGYTCMKQLKAIGLKFPKPVPQTTHFEKEPSSVQVSHLQTCSDGSLVQVYHPCPHDSPPAAKTGLESHQIRRFQCANNRGVHYTVMCDGYDDCGDNSDETLAMCQSRRVPSGFKNCRNNFELFPAESVCNGQPDCQEGGDENNCKHCTERLLLYKGLGCLPEHYKSFELDKFADPSSGGDSHWTDGLVRKATARWSESGKGLKLLNMDGYGTATINFTDATSCPDTHLHCPGLGMCFPSYAVDISRQRECPFLYRKGQKEKHSHLDCRGYYRCLGTENDCFHLAYLCDGIYHCPNRDDERHCNWTCPATCTCEGQEYTCGQMFSPHEHPLVRYLDLSGVFEPPLEQINFLYLVVCLNMSSCSLKVVSFSTMYALRVLDLSNNQLQSFEKPIFDEKKYGKEQFCRLTHLNLSGNPLVVHLTPDFFRFVFVAKPAFQFALSLSLSNMSMRYIDPKAFAELTKLKYLDISGNPLRNFARETFYGLASLGRLRVDDQRLCCVYRSQYGHPMACEAPVDELSSCSNLLRSPFLRITLWLQSLMAVVGNVGVLVFRVFVESQLTPSSYRVLVTNLCLADLLMGIYMMMVGAADAGYQGRYLWEQDSWTGSAQCRAAGFLALLSSEVSAFVICLITADRFLVLRFPFKPHLHLTSRSAMLACGLAWTVGVLLAAVPLLPITRHWEFYGQTGVCLPLPITRRQFPGQTYAFYVFIVLNFALFLLIGAGQLSIYRAIRSTPTAGRTQRRRQDMSIARRLFLIVLTDFCCWFPVGVMGLLAARGTPIPGEVNVWTAIFVLPLNSALNPFLYTLNSLLEKRQKQKEEKLLQNTVSRLDMEILAWPKERVLQFRRCCDTAVKRFEPESGIEDNADDGEEKEEKRLQDTLDRLDVDILTWPRERVLQFRRCCDTAVKRFEPETGIDDNADDGEEKEKEEQRLQDTLDRLDVDILTWPRERVLQFRRCCDTAVKRFEPETGIEDNADDGEEKEKEEKRLQDTLDRLDVDILTWPRERVLQFRRCYDTAVKRFEPETGIEDNADDGEEKEKEEKRLQDTLDRLDVDILTWPRERVLQFRRCCDTAVKRFEPESGIEDNADDGGDAGQCQHTDLMDEVTHNTAAQAKQ